MKRPSFALLEDANERATADLWNVTERILGSTGTAVKLIGALINRCHDGVSPLAAIITALPGEPSTLNSRLFRAGVRLMPLARAILRVRVISLARRGGASFNMAAEYLGRTPQSVQRTIRNATQQTASAWIAQHTVEHELIAFADVLRAQVPALERLCQRHRDFQAPPRSAMAGRHSCPVCGAAARAVA